MDTLATAINLTELENYGFDLKRGSKKDHPWGSIRPRPSDIKKMYGIVKEFEKKRKYRVHWGIEDPKLEIPEGYICIYIYLEEENSDKFIRNKNHIIDEYGKIFYDCIKIIKDCPSKRYILLDCSDEVRFHKIISFIHDSFKPW